MRLAPLLAALLVLLGVGPARGAVTVQVEGDRLTVRAGHASLQDILQEVTAAGHFALHGETSLADPITVCTDRQPLVLEWLLLAVMNRSTTDRYDGIISSSCNAQSAPGQIAVTTSRKDQPMNAKPRLTIEIVSDIV